MLVLLGFCCKQEHPSQQQNLSKCIWSYLLLFCPLTLNIWYISFYFSGAFLTLKMLFLILDISSPCFIVFCLVFMQKLLLNFSRGEILEALYTLFKHKYAIASLGPVCIKKTLHTSGCKYGIKDRYDSSLITILLQCWFGTDHRKPLKWLFYAEEWEKCNKRWSSFIRFI